MLLRSIQAKVGQYRQQMVNVEFPCTNWCDFGLKGPHEDVGRSIHRPARSIREQNKGILRIAIAQLPEPYTIGTANTYPRVERALGLPD